MKTPSILAALIVGAFGGAGLIVACSDDSPSDADAAVCDCPAAEPPLTGRIIVNTSVISIPANGLGVGGAGCPSGSLLIGGGCKLDADDIGIRLMSAGADRRVPEAISYLCVWSSTSATDRTGTGEAFCLLPPP